MLLFIILVLAAAIFVNNAADVTMNYQGGDMNVVDTPYNVPLDLDPGAEPGLKAPNVLQIIPTGCEAYTTRSKTQCQYKGKTYAVGAKVPDDEDLPCISNIVCTMKNKVPGFTYKRTSCAPVQTNKTSIPLYSFKSCCSTGIRSAVLKPKEYKCVFENKSYPLGASMTSNGCVNCICQRGFDGTMRAPWCKHVKCTYELDAHEGHAPVFSMWHCCPFKWEPPSASDVLLPNPIDNSAVSSTVCTHGKKKVKFGDGLVSTVASTACVICGCMVGPSVECGQLDDCSAALAALMSGVAGG